MPILSGWCLSLSAQESADSKNWCLTQVTRNEIGYNKPSQIKDRNFDITSYSSVLVCLLCDEYFCVKEKWIDGDDVMSTSQSVTLVKFKTTIHSDNEQNLIFQSSLFPPIQTIIHSEVWLQLLKLLIIFLN